ncbi:hypothetical protein H920_14313 [Fukomys damarensis]|uniref:Coiled-coil domain-containing protein 196 n=1 Tax=Fukomys damarensis TaxID=885580 RepID=A0A091D117_FUKDA|nr:hypothetical protein H920_14313 [Fukomys damarensis]
MTSGANSSESFVPSKSSKIDDNYLRELNEDLKIRKQELLEMLKPLEDKNNLLFQKLMSNLEEKQRSLQIMRQIMAGKKCDKSSVVELIKEAEDMKQNLDPFATINLVISSNLTLTPEQHISIFVWSPCPTGKEKQDASEGNGDAMEQGFAKNVSPQSSQIEELHDQQKAPQIKNKADLYDGKKNDCHGKVIELRIEASKNYQKANDLKLSLYLQQNFEPKQAFLNLP